MLWLFGKSKAGFDRKDLPRFLWCALTGVAINQLLFIKGLTLTSAIHASLLMLITPLLVTLFALWVLKEQFSWYKAAGLALGVGGATFLILQRDGSPQPATYLLGDTLVLLNAVSYSFYFILVKPLMEKYSSLHVIRWVFGFGFLMMLPFGWQQTAGVNWTLFHWGDYAAMAMIIVGGTFLAYYFNAYGIQHIGAGTTGSYIYTQPVFAVLIAVVFLHEHLSWQKLVSATLIFCGVYLVSFRRTYKDVDRREV